jgi:hypothetical protein
VAKATAGALAPSSTNKREIRTKSQSPILDYGWACGGRVGCGGDKGGGGRRRRRRATKAAAGALVTSTSGGGV